MTATLAMPGKRIIRRVCPRQCDYVRPAIYLDAKVGKLWQRYHETGSLNDRNALVVHYVPFTDSVVVKSFKARYVDNGGFVTIPELLSAGYEGLICGVSRFDPWVGVKPETYLSKFIVGSVLEMIRGMDCVSRRDRRKIKEGKMLVPASAIPISLSDTIVSMSDVVEHLTPSNKCKIVRTF